MPFQQVRPDIVLPGFEMASATEPHFGETINGDALFVETGRNDGAFLLLLVDVTHHGPRTLPTMQALQAALGDGFYQNRQPADLLQWLHDALAPQFDLTENFVAALAVRVEAGRADVTAANAGQPLPLLGRPGAAWRAWALPRGCFLGMLPGSVQYAEATTSFVSDDWLLAFTDGITEGGAKSGVSQFQHAGLAAFLASLPARADVVEVVRDLMAALSAHVGQNGLDDDTTAFCLRSC
jgi:serine phosphatase RsbU (regulator of sigma subunit)